MKRLNAPSSYPVLVMPKATAKSVGYVKKLMDERLLPFPYGQRVVLLRQDLDGVIGWFAECLLPDAW